VASSKKQRQRQLARDAYERRLQRQAERDRRAKKWTAVTIVVVVVVGIGLLSAFVAGAFHSSPAKPVANASHSPTAAASATATPSPTASASPTPTAALVNGKCVYTASGTAARNVKLPPAKPDTKAKYQATMATNRGNIVIRMLNFAAPCTVNSFVSLADQSYFNKTHCHRLTTAGIYVLQCGDPLGTGAGTPGYAFGNENLNGLKVSTCPGSTTEQCATFPPGTVAMANTGAADSNGGQFFLVYKTTVLPDSFTPFGTIVSGLNIIQNVAKAGSDNSNRTGDGHPKEAVNISSMTIKQT
jgi:peptidyl-prolyl cis-trans isomerase B (cyclophilin B)